MSMLLIKAGAIVNAINSEGKSALCVATKNMTNRYRHQSSEMTKKVNFNSTFTELWNMELA